MARLLESDYDFLSPEEIQLLNLTEPVKPEIISVDWMRSNPRLAMDRLADSTSEGREKRDYDERHL